MVKPKISTLPFACILSAAVFISACGGGSSSSGSSSSGGGSASNPPPQEEQTNRTVEDGVQGPLDQAQNPLFNDIFGQLVASAEGTPLAATLDCAGQAIIIDTIDVLDSIALALTELAETQDPASLENAATNIQFSLAELGNDLPGALGALTGSDCNGNSGGGAGGNPLAGTPLEPLGEALAPILDQLPSSGGDDPGNGGGDDADLTSLSALVSQLAFAFQAGLAQVPPEAAEAPIIGGVLTTLETALLDLNTTMFWLGRYDGEPAAAALEVTLNNLLTNVLTQVIPVTFAEEQAGQSGVISGPIVDGVDQLTATLGDTLLAAAIPQLTDLLDNQLAVLLDPIENDVLPALLLGAFSGIGGGGGGGGPTGTPLDLLLGPITDALTGGAGGGGGGAGPTGTPLDILLGPLLDLGGGSTACPFAGTPLEPSCALFDALPI